MCLQDWRLGRLIRAETSETSLADGGSVAIPAHKQRVGVTVVINKSPTAGATYVRIEHGGVAVGNIGRSDANWHITVATHGDLPMRSLLVIAAGEALIVGVTEYFLPEEFLTAGLEDFKKAVGI